MSADVQRRTSGGRPSCTLQRSKIGESNQNGEISPQECAAGNETQPNCQGQARRGVRSRQARANVFRENRSTDTVAVTVRKRRFAASKKLKRADGDPARWEPYRCPQLVPSCKQPDSTPPVRQNLPFQRCQRRLSPGLLRQALQRTAVLRCKTRVQPLDTMAPLKALTGAMDVKKRRALPRTGQLLRSYRYRPTRRTSLSTEGRSGRSRVRREQSSSDLGAARWPDRRAHAPRRLLAWSVSRHNDADALHSYHCIVRTATSLLFTYRLPRLRDLRGPRLRRSGVLAVVRTAQAGELRVSKNAEAWPQKYRTTL